jgi:hypothetical protein
MQRYLLPQRLPESQLLRQQVLLQLSPWLLLQELSLLHCQQYLQL